MILVVGAGFLGSYLLNHIAETSNEPVLATVRNLSEVSEIKNVEYFVCDITNEKQVFQLFEKTKNEKLTVFYFAACHNIDFIVENPSEAKSVNVSALENFFDVMKNIKKLFFASTDCVYGEAFGKKLRENQLPKPINEYGRQKLLAEKIIVENGFNVLRLPFMLGPSLLRKKHFYDRIISQLNEKSEVEMIDGMIRSVLSYKDAAELIFSLACSDEKLPSVINICGDKAYSKYDVGIILAKKIGADLSLVKKLSEKEGEKFFKDKRASDATMDNSLLKSILKKDKILWEEDIC